MYREVRTCFGSDVLTEGTHVVNIQGEPLQIKVSRIMPSFLHIYDVSCRLFLIPIHQYCIEVYFPIGNIILKIKLFNWISTILTDKCYLFQLRVLANNVLF